MDDARVDWHLENWAEFMRHGGMPVHGYPKRACAGIIGRGSIDFDEMVERSDVICAKAVSAILDSFVPRLRLAVYVKYGITAVYRVRDFEDSYLEARGLVATGLVRRGIV